MTFKDAIKNQLITGFSNADISMGEIALTLLFAILISTYIFFVYRVITQNAFYSKSFAVSMAVISVITAGIILAMQSRLVISLGMVGALSIVRFRTAIKEPMDLLFLFWSIGTGIICGAGLYKIGITLAILVTLMIVILQLIPEVKTTKILFVSSKSPDADIKISEILDEKTSFHRTKSQNRNASEVNLVYEIKTKDENELISSISNLPDTLNISLISSGTEFRG